MIFQSGARTLQLLLGSSEVQDHRPGTAMFERARLEVGHFALETVGDLQGCELRIDLWNAEICGSIQTTKGALEIRALALAQPAAIWLQTQASGDETAYTLNFVPGQPNSSRANPIYKRDIPATYTGNPPPHLASEGDIRLSIAPLENAQTAVGWKETICNQTRTLFCGVAHSFPGDGARQIAVDTVKQCFAANPADLLDAHRAWWHAYYPASFVSLPDAYWESFYWIQMYKLASATRAQGPLIDNHGPWLAETPWPYATWNLNVQLTYWPVTTANRVELGRSLAGAITRNRAALIQNVPEKYRADCAAVPRATSQDLSGAVNAPPAIEELDNLTWACENLWQIYRATMDDQFLRDELYPILRRSINYDLHFLDKGDDGKLHLPTTISPEYGDAPDANYNLALLRWGCHVLLASSARLKIDDVLCPRWREVLADLTPYPRDENGLMIGAGVALEKPHRHFSHLLMIYPLHLLDPADADERALMQQSLDWWMKKPQGQGYQFVGASAMAAMMEQGEWAFGYLDAMRGHNLIRAATMYAERGPVIETPLAAAQALHEMLLQSAGVWKTESETMPTPDIRIFPALPEKWRDATFQNLRAQGAFLVSAVRKNGKTQWIRLESLAGEKALLRPNMANPRIEGNGLKLVKDELYEVNLRRGEAVELFAANLQSAPAIEPVGAVAANANPFGLKLATQI